MTAPPFPIPRGMDWDPVKKRFFKKIPQKAKIEPSQGQIHQRIRDEKQKEQESIVAQQRPLPRSPFIDSFTNSLKRDVSISRTLARNSLPSHSSARRRVRAIVESKFGQMKHVSTTSLIPWRLQEIPTAQFIDPWIINIQDLYCAPEMGPLLFFSNANGRLFYLDTSHIVKQEESSAYSMIGISVFDKSDYFNYLMNIEYDWNTTGMSCLRSFSDMWLPCDDSSLQAVGAFNEEFIAMYHCKKMDVYRFIKLDNMQTLTLAHQISLTINTDADVRLLCMQGLPVDHSLSRQEGVLLAYSTEIEVGLIALQYDDVRTSEPKFEIAFKKMESDVICIELLPLGKSLFVGLRNGTVVKIDTKRMLEQQNVSTNLGSTSESTDYMTQHLVSAQGSGAVTHIKAISEKEIVIAYTNGDIFLIDSNMMKSPAVRYQGHVNSWSLDLPMTIDKEHRLLAAAGQDRKVRIWSLDYPLPLQNEHSASTSPDQECLDLTSSHISNKLLSETTFSAPISGLTFCQRRYIANLNQRHQDIAIGLPGLAVSCRGSEIAFFE